MKKNQYISRWLEPKIKELFENFPVVVVSGPRQVGKSTLLQHTFDKVSEHIVFDPIIDVKQARKGPELFVDNLKFPVILDEIQYSPQILAPLKRRIDREKNPGMVLITGSQQWSVMKNIAESMAGRAVFTNLLGFSFLEEIGIQHQWMPKWLKNPKIDDFEINSKKLNVFETVWRGGLPETFFIKEHLIQIFLEAYQKTYIERDARVLTDVSDWELFSRFMRLAAALSGQEINFSHFGRDIGVNPQTAKKWLNILKATFQWHELEAFSNNQIKKISEKPKGYVHDSGLICYLQSISSPNALSGHPMWGHIFESAIISDIKKQLYSTNINAQLSHFRLHSGAEVDLILETDGILFPIEIKGKRGITKRDAIGIESFMKNNKGRKIAPGLIISLESIPYAVSENIYTIPWDCSISPVTKA